MCYHSPLLWDSLNYLVASIGETMKTILIMKAWKLKADPEYPFLFSPEPMDTFDITDQTTSQEQLDKIDEWKNLGYGWDFEIKTIPNGATEQSEASV